MPPMQKRNGFSRISDVFHKTLLIVRSFSKRERQVFGAFLGIALISGLAIISYLNHSFMTEIPLDGGSITEGIVGTPRFINPVLAVSDADKDLTALTYSGLLRKGENGSLIPDLAKSYDLSPDGLHYTFTLKDGLKWSDGKPLTVDDIVFTINKIQDPTVRSPKASAWNGVSATKIDERTVKLSLKQSYAPFIENTTVGIVPKHIWENLSAEQWSFSSYNINPVGSGPYQVTKIQQNSSGIPEYYDLVPFKDFALGKPYIENIRLKFYTSDDALVAGYKAGEFGSVGALSPDYASAIKKTGARAEQTPLPRVFSVFMNQTNQPIFTSQQVRQALDIAVDKNKILNDVLHGFATPAVGPIPHGVMGSEQDNLLTNPVRSADERIAEARRLLAKDGWTFNEDTQKMEKTSKKKPTETLTFSLATSNAPELKAVANLLKNDWEKIGANVELKVYESGDLNQNVIRTRKYDALLFGEIVGTDPDPYAFWHSSQRFDPGLNIALYANITVDKLLEKARETPDQSQRRELYGEFQKEVAGDVPSIFLYSPDFIYVLPKEIEGVVLSGVTISSDRFANIYEWYAQKQNVWKIFADKK